MSLSKNVRKLRARRQLTQAQLARDSGLMEYQLVRIERNEAWERQAKYLVKIADALQVSVDRLLRKDIVGKRYQTRAN